jgi:hypothetical protein
MARFQNTKSGMTLIELIVGMGLLLYLFTVMTDIFVTFIQVRLESVANTAIQQDGDFILAKLFYDISRADSVTTPASNGASSNTLWIVIGGENYTYALQNGLLQMTNNSGTDRLNGSGTTISNLSFLRIGNPTGGSTVQLSFTETSAAVRKKGADVKNFSTTVGLRK